MDFKKKERKKETRLHTIQFHSYELLEQEKQWQKGLVATHVVQIIE
jgi:hypothetical protein